jgi:hypothetical protein
MTDLAPIAATVLANFVTIRIPRCERLWTWPMADPSTKLRATLLANALAGENLIVGYQRQGVRFRLLEAGHRTFFDQKEGDGRDGWRLHFFCLDPSGVQLLHDIPVGQCGPGDPVSFDPEKFVLHHLRRLERMGLLGTPDRWWDSVDE